MTVSDIKFDGGMNIILKWITALNLETKVIKRSRRKQEKNLNDIKDSKGFFFLLGHQERQS